MKANNNHGPANRAWWTNKRIFCIAAVLLAAAYTALEPKLEQWLNVDLPSLVDRKPHNVAANGDNDSQGDFQIDPGFLENVDNKDQSNKNDSNDSSSQRSTSGGFKLRETGRQTYESPAGLQYTMGPRGEHRIEHVMRHAKDIPNRGIHGVFDANEELEVLKVLDDAYLLIQKGGRNVRTEQSDGGRTAHTVDMPTRIGFVGGKDGARQNNPSTKRLKLILQGKKVITAYPTWPPRR